MLVTGGKPCRCGYVCGLQRWMVNTEGLQRARLADTNKVQIPETNDC